jgi:type I restriction enzyme S subunit
LPFEVPDGWCWATLGSIGKWQSGATPSRMRKDYYGGEIPWLKTGDLNDGFIVNIPETITALALNETSVKLNPAGSILIAMYGATIGKIGILTMPATTNQACCACISHNGIEQMYLFYYLLSHKEEFVRQGGGGAQPNISKEKIVETLIPIPPLSEQLRIIKAIEAIFNKIDNITAELS